MLIAVIVLPGCMNDMGDGIVSRFKGATPFAVAAFDEGAQPAVARSSDASDIIAALQSRTSVLIPGTPYSQIAQAEQDLLDIWMYTFNEWGEQQADDYLDELDTAIQLLA